MGAKLLPVPWQHVLPRWIAWYFAILIWEGLTIPAVSHSNSWQGVWLSLVVLPLSAIHLGRGGARPGTLFVYGCGGALLFVPRFLMMDRFSLWLQYQAPSDEVIILTWMFFALGMGAACWLASTLNIGSDASSKLTSKSRAEQRPKSTVEP